MPDFNFQEMFPHGEDETPYRKLDGHHVGIETFRGEPVLTVAAAGLTQLAAAENRGSGYSLADLKKLVEEVYVGARQQESRRLAGHVQAALLTALRGVNPGVEDRGVKTAPFIVLMTAEMPAILAEVSCLSNEREAELLARPLYREHIAEAVAAGIRAYAESLANPDLGGMSS